MAPRFWPILLAGLLCAALLSVNYVTGVFSIASLPKGYSSHLELIGQAIMFSLLTPYLILGTYFGRRYSFKLAAELDHDLSHRVRALPKLPLLVGMCLGAMNGWMFNLSPAQIEGTLSFSPIHMAVTGCNLLTWTTVGFALTLRGSIAWQFHQFGRNAQIDLFSLGSLKPFARNGLSDVLLSCGAMAFTVLQALDATFRVDNFASALAVAIPASAILFMISIYGIHKRIQEVKKTHLDEIQQLIDAAPRSLESTDMNRLEVLLQRRERITSVSTWPIDLSMLYRLFLYGVIPPLAWVAAALVEIYLESSLIN